MSYRVGFYREIVNSYGTPFKASVYTAELEALGSMDEAITIAIDRFKRDRELSCWSALADGYEVAYERKTVPVAADRDAGAAAGELEVRPAGDPRRSSPPSPNHNSPPREEIGKGSREEREV